MAEKLERKVMEIYGENAATRDIIAYGSDIAGNIVETKDPDVIQTEAYKTGVRSAVVGNNSTTLQNRQALDFLFSRQLKYLYQHGIAEWGADETYFVNSLAVGSNGNLYVSLTDNNKGNDPVTDTTNWLSFPTPAQLAQKVAKAGDTMTGALNVPTPSESENSTVVPTTAWVKKFLNDKLGKVYLSQSSLASDNSGALPLFTGETIASANTIYPDFYNWVLAHTELQCTSAEYESALSTYGECAKYVIGDGSLRLPLIKNYIKAANTLEGIKNIEAGLPNVTGDFNAGGVWTRYASGAFNVPTAEVGGDGPAGNGSTQTRYTFDASRSSAVYGKSDTVTPASTTLYPWVVAYAAAIPASTAQAAEFQQGLSGKADTNLGNVPANIDFVVESYDDGAGNGWYEYKSGRLVQYGFTTHSSGTGAKAYITFYRPMANTSYNYCVMPRGISGGAAFSFGASDFSVSGFSFSWDGASVDPEMVCWRVEGLKGA